MLPPDLRRLVALLVALVLLPACDTLIEPYEEPEGSGSVFVLIQDLEYTRTAGAALWGDPVNQALYEYNEAGLRSRMFYESLTVAYSYQRTYTYDANGHRILSRLTYYGQNQGVEQLDRFQNDAEGRVMESRAMLVTDGSSPSWNEMTNRILYERDEAGNLLRQIHQQRSGPAHQWQLTNTLTYTLNANGHWREVVSADEQGEAHTRWRAFYASDGVRMTRQEADTRSGGAWVLAARWTYTYDPYGNRIETLAEQGLAGSTRTERRTESLWDTLSGRPASVASTPFLTGTLGRPVAEAPSGYIEPMD